MPFTPVHSLVGGALLHLSTSTLLADTGRVLGISGVIDGAVLGAGELWRWALIAGLVFGPALGLISSISKVYPSDPLAGWEIIPAGKSIVAGLLVGLGTRLGSGCTSGHFLCGLSRGSKRSWIATAIFFSASMITAALTYTPPPQTSATLSYVPVYPTRQEALTLLLAFAGLRLSHSLLRSHLAGLKNPSAFEQNLPYLLSGVTFSYGLLLSGLADPRKVISFITPLSLPTFDPSLAMIVLSGVIPNAVHWVNLEKGKVRYPWEKWAVPNRRDIDWKLVIGSALFGIGWGYTGVCPGPAVVSIGSITAAFLNGQAVDVVSKPIFGFVGSMLVGMGLAHFI